jgi:hypothetical protein
LLDVENPFAAFAGNRWMSVRSLRDMEFVGVGPMDLVAALGLLIIEYA